MDELGIKDVAAMYGSPVDPRRGNIHINCPFGMFHSRGVDTSQGLSVKVNAYGRSPVWCFSCNTKGTLSSVFEQAAQIDSSLRAVAQFIAQRDGPSLAGALARLASNAPTPEQETPNSDWLAYAASCARQVPVYLIERGIIRADVERWRLGFDENHQRAIFPVRDENGHVVGALRRAVHKDQEPRYMDTPGAYVWKKIVFYGEDQVDRTVDTAIMVEGPMGTIFSARLFPNVLGMMGADTGCGPERREKLHRWGIRNIVLMLDSDAKGKQAVYGHQPPRGKWVAGLRDELRREFVVKVAKLPPKEDPDDVVRRDPTALRAIISGAAYLESTTLTGGPGHGSLAAAPAGRVNTITFLDYVKNRMQR